MNRLEGKVAFVTGAGGGIGRAICARFLAEGASVAAADIRGGAAQEAIAAAPAGRAVALTCDVSDEAAVRDAIRQTVEAFGKLDTLCNVAGGSSLVDARVTDVPVEEFWRTIRLDLFGTFLCCKFAIPELIRARGGSVINMASMVGQMGVAGRDCYTAAKGGIIAMTRSMAAEYAPDAIRVNAIAPGVTLSPRVAARVGTPRMQAFEATHLLGWVDPVDIAHMAVYLASDESRRVTGQTMSVDSGASAV